MWKGEDSSNHLQLKEVFADDCFSPSREIIVDVSVLAHWLTNKPFGYSEWSSRLPW